MNYVLNARKAQLLCQELEKREGTEHTLSLLPQFSLKEWKHYITEKNYIIVKTGMEEKDRCYGTIQYKGLTEPGWRGEAGICQKGRVEGLLDRHNTQQWLCHGGSSPRASHRYLRPLLTPLNKCLLVGSKAPLSIRRCCACSSKAGKQALGDELAGKGEVREAGRAVCGRCPPESTFCTFSHPHIVRERTGLSSSVHTPVPFLPSLLLPTLLHN